MLVLLRESNQLNEELTAHVEPMPPEFLKGGSAQMVSVITPELKLRYEDLRVRAVDTYDSAISEASRFGIRHRQDLPKCAAKIAALKADRPDFEARMAKLAAMPMDTFEHRLAVTRAAPGGVVMTAMGHLAGSVQTNCALEALAQSLEATATAAGNPPPPSMVKP